VRKVVANVKLPPFKKSQQAKSAATPEDVFFALTRSKSHGYLRGQQQDVLREYAIKGTKATDVAFELPTGTGKTTVGLLLAEWKRRAGEKVAYLTLNNQLAAQVLTEAGQIGVPVADLRGDKSTRSQAEVGKFLTTSAVAVSTYSNLFNTNPVIKDCGLLVLDDAHGGEHYVSDMWTVRVDSSDNPAEYSALIAALRPALSASQLSEILESKDYASVQIADIAAHPECMTAIRAVLDGNSDFGYEWPLISSKLASCLVLIGPTEVTIRPLVPPTHTHPAFSHVAQRVYLSATLGGKSDLQRAYGVKNIELFRAQSAQWGKRYIFVPGIFRDEQETLQIAGQIWDALEVKRALLIAPSKSAANDYFEKLSANCESTPVRFGADDIKDDLSPFTQSSDAILVLAGRYDGLDLPDDDCRFLLLCDSPAATNALERHLTSKWKMGNLIRRKERTRLIQGMGRCTRSATDFAVVLWLGQSLVDIASSKSAVKQMPEELQRELAWGREQVSGLSNDVSGLIKMAVGLAENRNYRKEANDALAEMPTVQPEEEHEDETGVDEVMFARGMWEGDYPFAYETARHLAENATTRELAGYRGWWWYLASVAARLASNYSAEIDCLWHSAKAGVYTGFAAHILSERKALSGKASAFESAPNVEGIWDTLQEWGWSGPGFDKKIDLMLQNLKSDEAKKFHQGMELFGRCLGSSSVRPTEDGAPDVLWPFANDFCFCFEAKTGKQPDGTLSKGDLEEAKLHPDWAKHHLKFDKHEFAVIVISATSKLDKIAIPFAQGLFVVTPDDIRTWASKTVESLRKIRAKYAGSDYVAKEKEFAAEINAAQMGFGAVKNILAKTRLK
jgi:hypothetical protein